jgi:hypothetical protein
VKNFSIKTNDEVFMNPQNRSTGDQTAEIFFELEEVVVGDKPFSLRDYQDELASMNSGNEPVYLRVYSNVGARTIRLLDEF